MKNVFVSLSVDSTCVKYVVGTYGIYPRKGDPSWIIEIVTPDDFYDWYSALVRKYNVVAWLCESSNLHLLGPEITSHVKCLTTLLWTAERLMGRHISDEELLDATLPIEARRAYAFLVLCSHISKKHTSLPTLVNAATMPIIRDSTEPPQLCLPILFENPEHILPGEFPSKRLDKASSLVKLLSKIHSRISVLYPIESSNFRIRLCNSNIRDEHNQATVTRLAKELHGINLDVTNTCWHLSGPRAFVVEIGKAGRFTTNHIVVAYSKIDFTLNDFNTIREIVNEEITKF